MKRHTKKFEKFVSAVRHVLNASGISLEMLVKQAPDGFWEKVGNLTGQRQKTAGVYWVQQKEKLLAELRKDAPHTTDEAPQSVTGDDGDKIGRKEVEQLISSLESRLTTMIKSIGEQRDRVGVATPFEDKNRPPEPEKIGKARKKLAGEKRDIRTRIDRTLFDLVERDSKAYFAGNLSKCFDAILWQYYGRPKLSFE